MYIEMVLPNVDMIPWYVLDGGRISLWGDLHICYSKYCWLINDI